MRPGPCCGKRQVQCFQLDSRHNAAIDHQVLGPGLDLDAVGLLVGMRQPRAIAVDHEVLENDAQALVPEDKDMPVTGRGGRVHELHDGFRPLAHDHEVVDAAQVQRPPAARQGDTRHSIRARREVDAALAVRDCLIDRHLDRCTIVREPVTGGTEILQPAGVSDWTTKPSS